MNDDALNDQIREGLSALMDQAPDAAPFPAERLAEHAAVAVPRPRGQFSAGRSRPLAAVAAVVLLAALAGAGWWSLRDDGAEVEVVDEPPQPETGFGGWEPGWHTIDPGPVPAMNGAQLAWTGDRLIVAGSQLSWPDAAVSQAFAYDPSARAWAELPEPPIEANRIVAAGDQLVVVGTDTTNPVGAAWATLAPGADEWNLRGAVPESAVLASTGAAGSGAPRDRLVWTGERVIDLSRGAVLDPQTGNATELPMPADLVTYPQLTSATPVWTGERVVLTSWYPLPGLAWNATGTDWEQVPGPVAADWPPPSGSAGAAAALGKDVVVVSEGPDDVGYSASLDPATGAWERTADVPGPSNVMCPYRLVAVGDTPVVQPCAADYETPLRLVDGAWSEIGPPPIAALQWLGTDDALITWSTNADPDDDPRAPHVQGAVWIPEGPATDDQRSGQGPGGAPRCDDGETGSPWPGTDRLISTGANGTDADLVRRARSALVELGPDLEELVGDEGRLDGCTISFGGAAGAYVSVAGDPEAGYRFGWVIVPARLRELPLGISVIGSTASVSRRDVACPPGERCERRLRVRYGDLEASANGDAGDDTISVDIDREMSVPGSLTVETRTSDGELFSFDAIQLPPGDFAAS